MRIGKAHKRHCGLLESEVSWWRRANEKKRSRPKGGSASERRETLFPGQSLLRDEMRLSSVVSRLV